MFTTDFIVCGIAPLATNLVVLSYDKAGEKIEVLFLKNVYTHIGLLHF